MTLSQSPTSVGAIMVGLLAACAAGPRAEPVAPGVVVDVSDSAEPKTPEPAPSSELAGPVQEEDEPAARDEEIREFVDALSELDNTVVMGRLGGGEGTHVLSGGATVSRGTSPPRGKVKVMLGPTTVNGGAVSNAENQIARMQPRFLRCYHAALANDPAEKGSLVLEIDLGPKGEVTQSRGAVRKGVSHGLQQCIEAVALAGRFSQPAGGSATLALQLVFELTR